MRRHGRARISARDPQASAICDRCGFMYNHVDLRWQMEFAGRTMVNKRLLVCDHCLDRPNPQLGTILTPPDPYPIRDPRPEVITGPQVIALTTESGLVLTTEDGSVLTTQNGT